jgi:phosphotransferase system HPr (HPr) family protein
MKRAAVMVHWTEGLHLRHAAKLVRTGQQFRSTILLRDGGKIADIRSILSVIALCATMGTTLNVEASGEDEREAAQAIEQVFVSSVAVALDEPVQEKRTPA